MAYITSEDLADLDDTIEDEMQVEEFATAAAREASADAARAARNAPRAPVCPVAPNGTEETEMNTGSKSVTVKYIANYWRVCWCNKLVRTYDTREEAEAAAASLQQSKAAG